MAEQLNKLPPWLAVVIMMLFGGGGAFGVDKIIDRLDKLATEINDYKLETTRRIDSVELRVQSHRGKIDGLHVKNREQDTSIRDVERTSARVETIVKLRNWSDKP